MSTLTHRYTIHARHPAQSACNGDHFATTFDPATRDLIVAMLRQRGFGEVTVLEQLISAPPPPISYPVVAGPSEEGASVAAVPALRKRRAAAKSDPVAPTP